MKPKKSLGQNFLKSKMALNKIVESGEISKDAIVLEIGPGKGALTEKLLEKTGEVIAVEKDYELFEFLKIKFEKEIRELKLIIINEDILQFDANAYGLKPSAYSIIANIPYNITGAILKKFLTARNQPEKMVLMVQNEVAKRIIGVTPASPRLRRAKESILSISVKAYGKPKIIMKVPARYFSPAPKVDSAIILIKDISRKFFTDNEIDEEKFWEIIHAGFAHKRKKLSGNLKKYQGESLIFKNGRLASVLNTLGNKRAEDLMLEDWISLIKS